MDRPVGTVKVEANGVWVDFVRHGAGEVTSALAGVDLTIREGELVAIIGPSGCGKSTLLNCIAGLVPTTKGTLRVDGREVRGPRLGTAVVFQDASLLPWRTVRGNAMFGAAIQRSQPRRELEAEITGLLDLVGLRGFAGHYPSELSGGMQQRVNLARALACKPDLLLLDEPFGSLDAFTREQMQQELLRILDATGNTAVFVTHDIGEAVYLADRVLVMSRRPARIIGCVEVGVKRPRPLDFKHEVEFVEREREAWLLLRGEN